MQQEVLKATKSRVFKIQHNFFKDYFIPAVITEWNNLDINIRNYFPMSVFKKKLLKFIRPEPNFTHNIHDYQRIKITYEIVAWIQSLKWMQVCQDCVSTMYTCSQDIETTTHFLYHCPNHYARKMLIHRNIWG